MIALGFVFYTESIKEGFWVKFYKIVPGLFMAYLIPAVFTSIGIIAPEWKVINSSGEILYQKSNLYYVAMIFASCSFSFNDFEYRFKSSLRLRVESFSYVFYGDFRNYYWRTNCYYDRSSIHLKHWGNWSRCSWRGLSTLAGSWIGGGANQTAMLEIYGYNQKLYGGMVFVDIVVANIWMSIILIGIGKSDEINNWLNADNSSINSSKKKYQVFQKIKRNPSLADIIIIMSIAFGTVSFAHFCSEFLAVIFQNFILI